MYTHIPMKNHLSVIKMDVKLLLGRDLNSTIILGIVINFLILVTLEDHHHKNH